MICPQCGQRNELGVRRCQACGQPFTRDAIERQYRGRGTQRAAARQQPAASPYASITPYDTYDAYDAAVPVRATQRTTARRGGRGRGRGCLLGLGAFGVLLFALTVAALLVANWYIKPMVRDAAVADLREGVQSEVAIQINSQIQDAPTGEVVISQTEINQRIDATGNLGPIDDVDVVITPAGLEVALAAYGLSGDYDAQVVERDGAIALEGGSLDGPLAFVVPDGDLESAVNSEIAAALASSGYRVDSVALGDGELTLVLVR